jgi:hypothetical protein
MPPNVKKQIIKIRRKKVQTLQQAPSAQQFEIAFNVMSNINKYKMQSFNSSLEALPNTELLEVMDLISGTGGSMSTEDKLKRISEYCGEIRTLVGIRNLMANAINRLHIMFIENAVNEYPSAHALVDTRKIKEDINIQLGIRAATATMSDT